MRARLEGARRNKALRGELFSAIPIGFVLAGSELRKDPDARVQAAILSVFSRFREAGTARQAVRLLQEAGEELPARRGRDGPVEWRPANYDRALRILKTPAMGGAYAYGFRRGVGYRGPLRPVAERWDILKPDSHEGFVSWPEWLAVQDQLAWNHFHPEGARGPGREGPALLQGLTVCGRCGLAMGVRYNKRGWRYACRTVYSTPAFARDCQGVSGLRIDGKVARLFLEAVTPAGAEAARKASAELVERQRVALRRWELDLEHCRYQAQLAERRYRQVDPDNRLIAATLERDWENALVALKEAEQALEDARSQ